MSKPTVFLGLLICVFLSILKAFGKNATNKNIVFLACNDFTPHAVYNVSSWRGTGTLSFGFNTGKSDSFIAYQDDQSFSYFSFFLVEGKMQTTVNFDNCPKHQITTQGNYSDAKWHQVRFERRQRIVRLSVDGCHSQTIRCGISGPSREEWHALYVGSIPFGTSRNILASPNILERALGSK